MAGRKPMGPKLVEFLEGSNQAKERLEVILQTIAGELSIAEACQRLAIGEAMFHRLRREVLQAGLAELEPAALGRPPRRSSPEQQRITELEGNVADLAGQLDATQVKLELAQALPHLMASDPQEDDRLKKTTGRKARQKRLVQWQRRKSKPR